MDQVVTLKKSGPKYGPEISRVIVIQMNWNSNDPDSDSFKVPDPKKNMRSI